MLKHRPHPVPDRWEIREDPEEESLPMFIGDYKVADNVRAKAIQQVLRSPSADLFMHILGQEGSSGASSKPDDTQKIVAQMFCQVFHYKIITGLTHGCFTSGETIILLNIEESDERTLYYYTNSLVPQLADDSEIRYLPVSQLASFAIMALESRKQIAEWISNTEDLLYQWPILPLVLPWRTMHYSQEPWRDKTDSQQEKTRDSRSTNIAPKPAY